MSEVNSVRDDYFEDRPLPSVPTDPPGSGKITLLAVYKLAVVASLVPIALGMGKRKRHVYSAVGTAPAAGAAAAAAVVETPTAETAAAEIPAEMAVVEALPAAAASEIPPAPAPTPETSSAATTTAEASPETSREVSLAASAAAGISPDDSPPPPPLERSPRCSDEHARYVVEIFTTIANTNAILLLTKKSKLDRLGNELRQHKVHPFEILRRMPRESICKILREKSDLVVKDVIKGLQEGMERERHTLERYAPGLAADMGKSAAQLMPLIRAGNWRCVVEYLFDIKPARKK